MILLVCARRNQDRAADASALFGAFTFALFKAYEPIKHLGNIYQHFQQALGTSTQVFSFLDLPEEVMDAPGAKVLPRFAQSIEFDDVSFAYDDGPLILKDINLTVPAGAVVAIVGSSGAGKTTLVNLLPRFYAADFRLGADRRKRCARSDACVRCASRWPSSRRKRFCSTTRFGTISATAARICPKKQVYAAAQAALAHDFIMEMPQGYQTVDRRSRPAAFRRPAAAPGHCARAC